MSSIEFKPIVPLTFRALFKNNFPDSIWTNFLIDSSLHQNVSLGRSSFILLIYGKVSVSSLMTVIIIYKVVI